MQRRRDAEETAENTGTCLNGLLCAYLCVSAGNTPLRWFRLPQFRKRSFLLLLGLFRCRFLHIGSGFLQIVDNFAVQFIDAGLAVPLREILRPLLADGDFLVPLAAARDRSEEHTSELQ